MEGGKKTQSGSSLTSGLFGSKNPASGSSSGIYGSLFTPPDKVLYWLMLMGSLHSVLEFCEWIDTCFYFTD